MSETFIYFFFFIGIVLVEFIFKNREFNTKNETTYSTDTKSELQKNAIKEKLKSKKEYSHDNFKKNEIFDAKKQNFCNKTKVNLKKILLFNEILNKKYKF